MATKKTDGKNSTTAKKITAKKAAPTKKHVVPPTPPPPVQRHYAEPKQVQISVNYKYDDESTDYTPYAGTLQSVPAPRAGASLVIKLEDILGTDAVNKITATGKIVFHSVGDTGADKQNRVADEDNVAAMMAKDQKNAIDSERPCFFYHLGDVVYEFGEAAGYYPQFYEPFCMYNAPIFAIPGNHDGMTYDPKMVSLQAFLANFCTPTPVTAPNAAGLLRSTMTQPGVYFTIDAPFVSIIGLYSNVSDKGPGVISSQGGKTPVVAADQKNFLIAELQRLKKLKAANGTAVIVALHHPPFYGQNMLAADKSLMNDIDDAFNKGGLWPDAILSGHAHLYERFARKVNGIELPYIIAGCGGYNVSPTATPSNPNQLVPPGSDPALQAYITTFGYLKIVASQGKLAIIFNSIDAAYGPAVDSILIDLKTHIVTTGKKGVDPL